MPEVQQYPSPVVVNAARIGYIPGEDGDTASIRFSVDGRNSGYDIISLGGSKAGRLEMIRAFPNIASTGQLVQVSTDGKGTISTCIVESIPLSDYRILKELTEGQITFKGNCTLQFYFDGTKLGTNRLFTNNTLKTQKFYFPSGSRGYVFQWKQVDNSDGSQRGYVSSVDIDIQLGDTEAPRVAAG